MAASARAEATQAARSTPVFMGHGREDSVLPVALGRTSRDTLMDLGYSVQWHEYAIPHSVSEDEIRDLARFLSEAIK
jgi:phospholipase/carboxylesterase